MKICSSYDEDCKDVKSPIECWLGKPPHLHLGQIIYTPVADGKCPLCFSSYKLKEECYGN